MNEKFPIFAKKAKKKEEEKKSRCKKFKCCFPHTMVSNVKLSISQHVFKTYEETGKVEDKISGRPKNLWHLRQITSI